MSAGCDQRQAKRAQDPDEQHDRQQAKRAAHANALLRQRAREHARSARAGRRARSARRRARSGSPAASTTAAAASAPPRPACRSPCRAGRSSKVSIAASLVSVGGSVKKRVCGLSIIDSAAARRAQLGLDRRPVRAGGGRYAFELDQPRADARPSRRAARRRASPCVKALSAAMPAIATATPKWAIAMPQVASGVRSGLRPISGRSAAPGQAGGERQAEPRQDRRICGAARIG